MLGIIVGVGAVIAMISVGSGAQERVAARIRNLGANLIVISPGSALVGGVRMGQGTRPTLTSGDVAALVHNVPGVLSAAASMWVHACCQVVYGNLNWWTTVQGTEPQFEHVRQWPVVAGRFFTPDDLDNSEKVALIGQTVAAKLFGSASPLGEIIRVGQVPFTVMGVLETKGQNARGQDQDDVVLIPLTTARRLIVPWGPRGDGVHGISIRIREGFPISGIETGIRDLLRQRHALQRAEEDDFKIQNLAELMQAEEDAARTLAILLGAIASVSLVVGGIGVMNIMLVSVTERTREIGLRIAVGARGADILTQFLVESTTLSLAGGTIGVACGIASTYVIAYLAGWRTPVSFEALALSFLFAGFVGVSAGLYPALKAAALNPIDALRYE
jgi:putative ABC transport system permease protein